jgi:lipoprotein NlpI
MFAGIILVICAILAACSPSQVELDAPDTELAIDTSATQTTVPKTLFALAYTNRGAVYADNGELEKALDDFNMGLELDPTNPYGYSNRGTAFFQSENLDMAMEDVKSLLALTEDEQYIINALLLGGMIYEQQGETGLALSAFSTSTTKQWGIRILVITKVPRMHYRMPSR